MVRSLALEASHRARSTRVTPIILYAILAQTTDEINNDRPF